MKIVKIGQIPKRPVVKPLFTSPDVTDQLLFWDESKDLKMGIVNFGVGVRNGFHIHPEDQILIVTEGKGIVATEEGEREVAVGDAIFFPAGERHWHGAAPDSTFSHICVRSRTSS